MVTLVVFYYTFDERGNVAQRLDGSGNVLSTDLYDAYGVRTSTYALNNPWGFGAQWGYYTDTDNAIGLVLLTHRFYDRGAGRFINRDPIGYDGGIDLYAYTANDPINRIDTMGWLRGKGGIGPGALPILGGILVAGGIIVIAITLPVTGPILAAGGIGGALLGGGLGLGGGIIGGLIGGTIGQALGTGDTPATGAIQGGVVGCMVGAGMGGMGTGAGGGNIKPPPYIPPDKIWPPPPNPGGYNFLNPL